MIKKCSKYLFTAICVFFISMLCVNAKEVTIDEMTQLVKSINPSANSVFVIGEYAFTSAHELTTEDIMLAARSIQVLEGSGDTNKDPIYEEMTIASFTGTLGSDWKLEKLTYSTNLAGTAPVKEKYNIRYVDYNKIYDEIDLVGMAKNAYNKYSGSLSSLAATELDSSGTKLTVTLKNLSSDLSMYPLDELKEKAKEKADKFFSKDGIKSVTVTLTTSDNKAITKEITSDVVDTLYAMTTDELKEYASENGITIDSLMGGKVTAKVNLEADYKAVDGIDTFEAEIFAELDLKAIADKAYNKYETNYADKLSSYGIVERVDDTTFAAKLKVVPVDIDSLPIDKIKEVGTTLLDKASKVAGVKSVTVTLTTADSKIVTKDVTLEEVTALLDMSKDELVELIKKHVNENDLTVDSLVGAEITAKANLKTGYSATDGIDTFKLTTAVEVDFKALANAAYNKYESSYAEKLEDYVVAKKVDDTTLEITAKVLITDTSLIPQDKLDAVKAKLKELKTYLDKVTYVPGLESVEITLTPSKGEVITQTITEEQILVLKDKSFDELKAIAKEFIENKGITIDSIIGGEVTAKANLKTGYTAKDGVDTFKAIFKSEIDLKGLANAAYDKYESSYADKLKDYVATKKVDDTTLEVTAKVLITDTSLIPEDKLNQIKEKAKELLDKVTYIPAVESVTFTLITSEGKTVTANITEEEALALKEKSLEELKTLVKEFAKANNLTIDSIIGGEATAKINLKAGYSAKDGVDTFKAIFKAEYDFKSLANTAYDTFKSDYEIFVSSVATVEKADDSYTEYNVTVKTTDETILTTLANQLKSKAGNLFDKVSSVPGVDTITVKLITSDSRTFTKNITYAHLELLNEMTVDEIKQVLKEKASKYDLTVSSILGGTIESKINLKKGYSAKDNVDTFKINLLASEYDVKFDVDGQITFKSVKVGGTVEKPENPTKEGYTFDKWLLNGEEYDFTTKVNAPITLKASWTINTYEVKIESNDINFGTVSKSTLTVEHGTTITTDGNKITIGSETITATPATNTSEYKYSFGEWEGVPAKVTEAVTIKANFKQEESFYKITLTADDGTVSKSTIENVKYGTAITTDGNTLKIGDETITAEPKAKDAQYTYSFDKWSVANGTTVTSDIEISASFKKEINTYIVSFSFNDDTFGKVSQSSVTVEYGSEIKVDGNKITIGNETITATPADNTAEYKYSFKAWTNVPASGKVTEGTVIYANFNQTLINLYTLTFKANDSALGSVNIASITDIEEGTPITINGNKITIGTYTVEATAKAKDAQYTYSFVDWTAPATVTADATVTANFSKTLNNYTVTFKSNDDNYGTLSSTSVTVPYGSSASIDGNKIKIGDKEITATPKTQTETNYYTLEGLSSTAAITGDTEITVNFKEWTIVDVAKNVTNAVYAEYGNNNLGESHTMDFAETGNNTITLKYSGTKSSKWFLLYTLNGTAVESFDIIQLMEKLIEGHDDIYESVVWDYKGWKTKNDSTGEYEYLDILKLKYDEMTMLGFNAKNWSCTIFSRFMSNLSGLSGGTNFANIEMDTIIANTAANPIKMKIKLKDGYITKDGETEVIYDVKFTK